MGFRFNLSVLDAELPFNAFLQTHQRRDISSLVRCERLVERIDLARPAETLAPNCFPLH
jgi:hypothetical protein